MPAPDFMCGRLLFMKSLYSSIVQPLHCLIYLHGLKIRTRPCNLGLQVILYLNIGFFNHVPFSVDFTVKYCLFKVESDFSRNDQPLASWSVKLIIDVLYEHLLNFRKTSAWPKNNIELPFKIAPLEICEIEIWVLWSKSKFLKEKETFL